MRRFARDRRPRIRFTSRVAWQEADGTAAMAELGNWRVCKKQQMIQTRAGAQYLLHLKTAELNGTLHRYTLHILPRAMAA